MRLQRLWLTDFRSYESAELAPAPGLTAIVGANGKGKSNLLEAVAWLATLGSFRGSPTEALVRVGAAEAVVRAEVEGDDPSGRVVLLEAVLRPAGRDQVLVNRQRLRRARDLLGSVRVTVFSPDDLSLVKGAPGERRRLLDDALVLLAIKHDALRGDLERVLRQRGTLLRQAGGRATPDVTATLEVWDAKLAELGEATGRARRALVDRLQPVAAEAYDQVASARASVTLTYDPPWRRHPEGLAGALADARAEDLRRGVTTVGPHRDEVELAVNGLPARTHASQGEQRSLALALRLATHRVVTDVTGASPILLLDDVFSELDADRSHALLSHLPPGQALLTTAGSLPEGAEPGLVVRVAGGRLVEAGAGSAGGGLMPWHPLPTPDGAGSGDPEPVRASLDRVARRLGVGRADTLPAVFGRWAELVGAGVAERTRPQALRGTTLVVAVDDPSWASQLRWLEADLVARIAEDLGPGVVTALELVVRPGRPEPGPLRRP